MTDTNTHSLTDVTAESRRALWLGAGELKRHWYVAAQSSEVKVGALHAASVLGLGIVLRRCRDGRLVTMLDQCLHRGTAVSGGTLVDDCIVCPYHGWRYDHCGMVVHIPSLDGAAAHHEGHPFRQRVFPTREAYGLIWIYLGDDAQPGEEIFEMPYWHDENWVCYYMVSNFDAGVSALAQNFMDVPHTVFVHEKVFRSRQARTIDTTVSLTPRSVEVNYHDSADTIGMMPWLTNPDREPLAHTDKFFAPNITRCDYHWGQRTGLVITSQMTPIDQQHCRVYTLISYRFSRGRVLQRCLRPLIHAYTRYVINQDVRIIQTNRRGLLNAPDFSQHSVEADIVHLGIERLIEAYRQGAPLPPEHLGKRSMCFNI